MHLIFFFIEYDIIFFTHVHCLCHPWEFYWDTCFDKGGNPIGGLGCIAQVGHMETIPLLFLVFFTSPPHLFVGLAYEGEDIVFKFIIEYSSLRDFGFLGNNRSIFI